MYCMTERIGPLVEVLWPWASPDSYILIRIVDNLDRITAVSWIFGKGRPLGLTNLAEAVLRMLQIL